jgi:hypothetical protein
MDLELDISKKIKVSCILLVFDIHKKRFINFLDRLKIIHHKTARQRYVIYSNIL